MTRTGAAAAGLALLLLTAPAFGQASGSVSFGENADAATGVSSGSSLLLGVGYRFPAGDLFFGGGVPVEAGGVGWASATGWFELPDLVRPAGLGLRAGGQAFGYRDARLGTSGGAVAGDVQGYRTFVAGPALLRLRGGARAGALSAGGRGIGRLLGRAGGDATYATDRFAVRAASDVWFAPEDAYPELSLSAFGAAGPVRGSAHVSRWVHDALPETGWSAGVEVALAGGLALIAGASRPATDILFFSPAQRSWSIGLRYGRSPAAVRALPAPVFADAGETVRLHAPVRDDGGDVRIAGTFSGWEPRAMQLQGNHWVIELRLPAGLYEYAFVAPDGGWYVPEGTPGRKADGFGGFVATLVVR